MENIIGLALFFTVTGLTACSATGDTPQEAFQRLNEVAPDIFQAYLEMDLNIPEPYYKLPQYTYLIENFQKNKNS